MGPEALYPGSSRVEEAAHNECVEQFESYVGVTYAESELFVQTFHPLRSTWEDGDRSVTCALFAWDEEFGELIPRAESAKASS
jgi:hypothetical protein